MNNSTKEKLFDAWDYCDTHDKSTEFMLQYMADFADIEYDAVVDFIVDPNTDKERAAWYNRNSVHTKIKEEDFVPTDPWKEHSRPDLNAIPEMMEKGFKVIFSYSDINSRRTNPSHPPKLPVNFQKDDLVIWEIIRHSKRSGWNTAYLTATGYVHHQRFSTLEEASARESKMPKKE